jgi:hypothetical protein
MEKLLIGCESKDDFIVKSVQTEPLEDDDLVELADSGIDTVKTALKHRTSIIAERADGAVLLASFCHGEAGIISDKLSGAITVGEMRIGFYLRKEEKVTESRIISLSGQPFRGKPGRA